jgi:hypothetical protein
MVRRKLHAWRPVESNLSRGRKDFEQFQSYLTFSQKEMILLMGKIISVSSEKEHA